MFAEASLSALEPELLDALLAAVTPGPASGTDWTVFCAGPGSGPSAAPSQAVAHFSSAPLSATAVAHAGQEASANHATVRDAPSRK
jgi:hypothetical protein